MLCRIASRDLLQKVVKKILLALNLLIMQELSLEVDWSYIVIMIELCSYVLN